MRGVDSSAARLITRFLYLLPMYKPLHHTAGFHRISRHTAEGHGGIPHACCVAFSPRYLISHKPISFHTDLCFHSAKFQFVDQGPELENYYSQDDLTVSSVRPVVEQPKSDNDNVAYKRVGPSPYVDLSPTVHSASTSDHLFLSPSATDNETVLIHSPIKKQRTTDLTATEAASNVEQRPHTAYDPIRSQYRVYNHPPKHYSPLGPCGTYMSEQRYVPKVVEAEYRRLADSAAAAIPPESLLSPAIWKEEFYWPNQFTTTQCACLMRYYIDHLAAWASL